MIVKTFIDSIRTKFDHPYLDQDILDFINDMEQSIYTETVKEFAEAKIALVKDQASYTFPTSVTLESIEAVFVNGVSYEKRDLRQNGSRGYYKDNGKLCFYPVPTQTDTSGKESALIVYRTKPVIKLLTGIATDMLSLPDSFVDMYRYYVYGQICLLQKEFSEAQNWLGLYNGRANDLTKWWNDNRPKAQIPYKRRW